MAHAAPSPPVFELVGVDFAYQDRGKSALILKDFSFAVPQGAVLGVLGPTGVGKSTLIRVLAGLDSPAGGEVLFNGASLLGPHREIALVPQHPSLLPWRTVADNFAFFARFGSAESQRRGRSILDYADLISSLDLLPSQLSVGMQQVARLACGVAQGAKVLLLDEPLASVDVLTRSELGEVIRASIAVAGLTAILVTHSPAEAALCCSEIVVVGGRPMSVRAWVESTDASLVDESSIRELLRGSP